MLAQSVLCRLKFILPPFPTWHVTAGGKAFQEYFLHPRPLFSPFWSLLLQGTPAPGLQCSFPLCLAGNKWKGRALTPVLFLLQEGPDFRHGRLFSVPVTVLCFGFRMRMMLITHCCFYFLLSCVYPRSRTFFLSFALTVRRSTKEMEGVQLGR